MRVLMISRPTLFSVPGGDTVQVKETARALSALGVDVEIKLADEDIDYAGYDLLHFFNVIRPNAIRTHAQKSGLPYVVSTVFVDYSEIEQKYKGKLYRTLHNVAGSDGLEYLKTVARTVKNKESIIDKGYLLRGHKKSVEEQLNRANMLLPNSESEFRRLSKRYRFNNEYRVIPNGVSDRFFQDFDPDKKSGVLCVGRIEVIKNQLNLIKAVKNTEIQLTLIGQPAPNHMAYYEACRAAAGDNVKFLGQQPVEAVIEAMRTAKVHALPSFFETTGLSSLEAGAMGCNLVITAKGDTVEYFGDHAYYCEPDQPDSILKALKGALKAPVDSSLRDLIDTEYRWKITGEKTLEAYKQVLSKVK